MKKQKSVQAQEVTKIRCILLKEQLTPNFNILQIPSTMKLHCACINFRTESIFLKR